MNRAISKERLQCATCCPKSLRLIEIHDLRANHSNLEFVETSNKLRNQALVEFCVIVYQQNGGAPVLQSSANTLIITLGYSLIVAIRNDLKPRIGALT